MLELVIFMQKFSISNVEIIDLKHCKMFPGQTPKCSWIHFGLWNSFWLRVWKNSQVPLSPQKSFGLESENHCENGNGKRGNVPEGARLCMSVRASTLPVKKYKRNRLRGSWLRPQWCVTDIKITSNYHHTSAFHCCCLCFKMSQWILKGALCSLKGKKKKTPMFCPFTEPTQENELSEWKPSNFLPGGRERN